LPEGGGKGGVHAQQQQQAAVAHEVIRLYNNHPLTEYTGREERREREDSVRSGQVRSNGVVRVLLRSLPL
jgi:hypothetical protein